MTDLVPTLDSPGLHVVKPFSHVAATGSYICGCGDAATANGDADVWALVQDYAYFHGQAHTGEGR
ncbi:hypothetical protein ABZ916_32045 [Streptomyces sp. NPDC046853]|uniref:hypothetical protein n=1 Tax=Streptomyces sp. NPDC046853 TaxID=3154920 RepID=UPI0033D54651